jgi:hypothetical protein
MLPLSSDALNMGAAVSPKRWCVHTDYTRHVSEENDPYNRCVTWLQHDCGYNTCTIHFVIWVLECISSIKTSSRETGSEIRESSAIKMRLGRNHILALWKYVEMVQYSGENQQVHFLVLTQMRRRNSQVLRRGFTNFFSIVDSHKQDEALCGSVRVWNLVSDIKGGTQTRVFENRVLRGIFGPKREVTGSWRKLHNEELRNLYS